MPYLNCSRCGLSIRPRIVPVEHCPRCIARSRVAVPMFRSPLPMRELVTRRPAVQATPTRG